MQARGLRLRRRPLRDAVEPCRDMRVGAVQRLADLVAEAYRDTPRALWGLAERSLLAHLVKLAREHRAIDRGDGRWSR